MRSRTLVAAGAAVVALAGCSTSIAGQASPQAATGQGGGAQIASVADLGAVVQHTATAKDSVHFESSINIPSEGAVTATGDLRFGNGQGSGKMTMNLPGIGQVDTILAGTMMYLKLPANLMSQLGQSSKPWVEVSLAAATNAAIGSTADMAKEMDPTYLIDEMKSAGTITQVSHEQIDGVSTTHYSINVSVSKLAQSMTDNPTLRQALATVTVPNVPFDLWIDSSNLPVRIVMNMFSTSGLSSTPVQTTTTTNYSQWGEQVSISPPPADQVTTLGG